MTPNGTEFSFALSPNAARCTTAGHKCAVGGSMLHCQAILLGLHVVMMVHSDWLLNVSLAATCIERCSPTLGSMAM